MLSDTARMIGTVGIWCAVAVILTFGVFRIDWNGEGAMFVMLAVVAMVCGAAALSTVAVWRRSAGDAATPRGTSASAPPAPRSGAH